MELNLILKRFGLTDNEVKVYLKLLTLGESTASNLGKETHMERRTAYDVVNKLLEKGLLSFFEKDEKKFYRPLSPLRLLDILDEREDGLKKTRQEFIKVFPLLEKIAKEGEKELEVRVLEGKEGLRVLYMDEIKEGSLINLVCTTIDKSEELLKNFIPNFTRARVKRRIKMRIISTNKDVNFLKKYKLTEVRFLPDEYTSPASMTIFRNKLGIILWAEKPIVILIKNKEVADNFLKYFELMWKIAEK